MLKYCVFFIYISIVLCTNKFWIKKTCELEYITLINNTTCLAYASLIFNKSNLILNDVCSTQIDICILNCSRDIFKCASCISLIKYHCDNLYYINYDINNCSRYPTFTCKVL